MNLDEQLRAALDLEAEMQNAPAPDLDRLISGGRDRRRRRNTTRFGIAAAIVAVLVGVGVYGVMQLDSESALEPAQPSQPSESATTAPPLPIDGRRLEPDTTYRTLVGVDGTGATLDADLTVYGSGWTSGNFPVVTEPAGVTAVWLPTSRWRWPPVRVAPAMTPTRTSDRPRKPSCSSSPSSRGYGRPGGKGDGGVRPRRDPPARTDRQRLPGGPGLPRCGDAPRQSRDQLHRQSQGRRHGLLGRGPRRNSGRGRATTGSWSAQAFRRDR